jgi:hypothetical protein
VVRVGNAAAQTNTAWVRNTKDVNNVIELYKTRSQVNTIAKPAKVDSVEISEQSRQLLRAAQAKSSMWDFDEIIDTVNKWYNKGKQWLSTAADYALAAAKEGLDFLILDDLKTLFDPNADAADKALAAVSLFPAGKATKAFKLLKKFDPDVAKFADRALSGKVKIGKYYVKSRIGEDSLLVREAEKAARNPQVQRDWDNLIRRYLDDNVNPGSGNKFIPGIPGVFELRAKDSGARVYLRKMGDTVEILAKSDKDNQKVVIQRLKRLYGR